MASALAASVVAWSMGNALMVGLASVAAGVVARALGRRWGVLLVLGGGAFAGDVALGIYRATGDLLVPLLVGLGGLLGAAIVGYLLRGVPMVGSVIFLAAGWYLVLYAYLGSFVRTSILGDLALGGLIMGSALFVHHSARAIGARHSVEEPAYPPVQPY